MIRTLYDRPKALIKTRSHYCPGCSHGVVHRLVAEAIDELGLREKTVGISSVGCSVLLYDYLDVDVLEAAHGRAPAVATGVKRVLPDRFVFTYQGDGDLASIGMAEIIHAAARGENISVIYINNTNYGMTGGQMAPTTLPGQKTSTSPFGRDVHQAGYPLHIAELLSALDGPAYITRVAVHSYKGIVKTKKAIKRAFACQEKRLGFSLVEVLAACPTNFHMPPLEAMEWVKEHMEAYYPLGVYRDFAD